MDREFGDQQSSSRASDGGEEFLGVQRKVGSFTPMSGSAPVKYSGGTLGRALTPPRPSTVSFRDDARSIIRLTRERKALGSEYGGGFGIPEPGTGDYVGAKYTR